MCFCHPQRLPGQWLAVDETTLGRSALAVAWTLAQTVGLLLKNALRRDGRLTTVFRWRDTHSATKHLREMAGAGVTNIETYIDHASIRFAQ